MDERDYRRVLKARAAAMRRQPTIGEKHLWRALAGSKTGFKIRRQKVIGNRICDFFCPQKNAAIEVDGITHTPERDARWDADVRKSDVVVLRISSEEIETNMDGVVATITHWLGSLPNRWPPHPNPSPEGEGL